MVADQQQLRPSRIHVLVDGGEVGEVTHRRLVDYDYSDGLESVGVAGEPSLADLQEIAP